MKKIIKLTVLFLLMAVVVSAGGYKTGVYRGSRVMLSQGYPHTDFVTIVVGGKGKIVAVLIDATYPVDTKNYNKGFTTKQLLGDDYGMRRGSSIDREWNEQVDAIAEDIIKNQGIKFKLEKDGAPDGVAGATINVEPYVRIIEEILEEARKK